MKNLFKLALVFVLQISGILFSQNRIDLPSRGETIELEGNSRDIPYEFNNVNENDNNPYSFLYSSEVNIGPKNPAKAEGSKKMFSSLYNIFRKSYNL